MHLLRLSFYILFMLCSTLPKQDLEALVKFGCPSLFRKAVNSSKRLRAFLQIDEGDVS